ncbi:MAG: MGH1-like glycoside hydrolase domain-containing protein [Aureliella sp.]
MTEYAHKQNSERERLAASEARTANWQRWGSYLSARQWGTVREDYSANQDPWLYFPHDHARSRAYRWGEDGLLGICDRECRLCFSLALWNTRDPILKERFFGLTNAEGNHGEDVKECFYYLDNVPTHSYMRGLYKYPQCEYPYVRLLEENRRRNRRQGEFELADAGVFDEERYFDCFVEYAKDSPDDVLIKITIHNRGPEEAVLHVLPQWWFRNTWTWECTPEGCPVKPSMRLEDRGLLLEHATLGQWRILCDQPSDGAEQIYLFTENETNPARHPDAPSLGGPYLKDAFHAFVVDGKGEAVNPQQIGTKVAAYSIHTIPPGEAIVLRARMASMAQTPTAWFGDEFEAVFEARKQEADEFYDECIPPELDDEQREISRQAYAGLLWSKQFYHYGVQAWIEGDPNHPPLPKSRQWGRNSDWESLFNRDVISMPDKWEYPWYAAWDLAFHMLPMARVDQHFAEHQLVLFLREWYMHLNGKLPAYEWSFDDVNPPVHAWACWTTYLQSGPKGKRNVGFLAKTFQKLLLNFTWWVNRKDVRGNHIFNGGFLGLDNIGVFDRNKPLPNGAWLNEADATAWMVFYCGHMLRMALELAVEQRAYADMASKFFEHYLEIVHATNTLHGTGLWDDEDGFYYDHILTDHQSIPLKLRSLVGLIPLCTPVIIEEEHLCILQGFRKRMLWFFERHEGMARYMTNLTRDTANGEHTGLRLMALPSGDRLKRMLEKMLDENEFLSPYGIRSMSAIYGKQPFLFEYEGAGHIVRYAPGESDTDVFGGNSNWRGPVWFPINYLICESLRTYHSFYGDRFQVECPTGSGKMCTLGQVADEIESRLIRLFVRDESGHRPCFGDDPRYANNPNWQNLLLFNEYFHGDNGRGLGASHQTGWTSLVATLLENRASRMRGTKPHTLVP